jgi:hypothetical protein
VMAKQQVCCVVCLVSQQGFSLLLLQDDLHLLLLGIYAYVGLVNCPDRAINGSLGITKHSLFGSLVSTHTDQHLSDVNPGVVSRHTRTISQSFITSYCPYHSRPLSVCQDTLACLYSLRTKLE